MTLQHKYRPSSLDEFFGNSSVIENVRVIFNRKKEYVPHAFLITGPSGTGKTTLAYIIGDMLGCSKSAFTEFDASTDRGIKHIRKIREDAAYRPIHGDITVVFFDEAHGITGIAQEAMLKLLEDPPPHVYLILATTEPEKLKTTIIRRCHQLRLAPLIKRQMAELLRQICEAEDIKLGKKVLGKINRVCWGSPGQAVKLLDQISDMSDDDKALEAIDTIAYSEAALIQIIKLLIDDTKKREVKWDQMRKLLITYDGDVESSRYAILTYLEKVLLNSEGPSFVPKIINLFCDSYMYTGRAGLSVTCYLALKAEEKWKEKNPQSKTSSPSGEIKTSTTNNSSVTPRDQGKDDDIPF